jgi:hypothetical protein
MARVAKNERRRPNEGYEVVPIEPGPHGPLRGWLTVVRNGMPVRVFRGKEKG